MILYFSKLQITTAVQSVISGNTFRVSHPRKTKLFPQLLSSKFFLFFMMLQFETQLLYTEEIHKSGALTLLEQSSISKIQWSSI